MVRLTGTVSRLGKCKALVIGDFVLDTYTIGKVRRISPEAPVAVVHVQNEINRPGMAGNVALNLISMGCEVAAIGRIGENQAGNLLLTALSEEKIQTDGLMLQRGYTSPIKNRIIADNQQIVRVDHEVLVPLPEMLEQQLIDRLPALMDGVHVIAISDYGKGFLTPSLLSVVIDLGRKQGIPVIADPKGIDFAKYARSTIIKPNLSEVYAAAGMPFESQLDQAAAKVLRQTQCDVLMVTRSEEGISLFYQNGNREDYPVKVREVKDVTGAGDTVLSMMACALGNGLPLSEAVQLSNIAAGIAIEKFGCARISLSELTRRLLEHDVNNKIFDEEHLFALQQVLDGSSCILLGITGEHGLTTPIFNAIRQLAQRSGCNLLVYVKDSSPHPDFMHLLASLQEVDFILVKAESVRSLCQKVTPKEIYEIKHGDLRQISDTAELLAMI